MLILDFCGASVGRLFTTADDLAHIYDSHGRNDGQFCRPDFYLTGDTMQKPFEGVENLEAAYDLETPEDNIKLYAAWADTYDTGYRASMDYVLHRRVGETYHALGGGPKVLDIGAGTGALA